jgi:uncharacterized protein related to proFAR isomerase
MQTRLQVARLLNAALDTLIMLKLLPSVGNVTVAQSYVANITETRSSWIVGGGVDGPSHPIGLQKLSISTWVLAA